jgi:hypothetical protein
MNKNARTLLANFPAAAANIDTVPESLEGILFLGSLDFINDSDGRAAWVSAPRRLLRRQIASVFAICEKADETSMRDLRDLCSLESRCSN